MDAVAYNSTKAQAFHTDSDKHDLIMNWLKPLSSLV
jgi:hypothetical protein